MIVAVLFSKDTIDRPRFLAWVGSGVFSGKKLAYSSVMGFVSLLPILILFLFSHVHSCQSAWVFIFGLSKSDIPDFSCTSYNSKLLGAVPFNTYFLVL